MRYTVAMMTGPQKTAAIRELAIRGAETEPLIREAAIRLVANLPRGAHRERIARLHEWVRDSVQYHREPVEMLHPASYVAIHGGDCDDHVILLGALAWALKYPFTVRPVGDPRAPGHYAIRVGYPETETPAGQAGTHWLDLESTIPAFTGETTEAAALRLRRQVRP